MTGFKPRASGRNIVGQQLPILLDVTCYVRLHTLLRVVAQSLKAVKLFSQQLPTFLLFRDRRRVAQQCWIRLHSSSNIVGATQAHYAWFTKTYGLYPSHDALQVPTLLGVVASVCSPLATRTQQLPTLLSPFARSLNTDSAFGALKLLNVAGREYGTRFLGPSRPQGPVGSQKSSGRKEEVCTKQKNLGVRLRRDLERKLLLHQAGS